MSAQYTPSQSPEHFEIMRNALDHIARTARKSRSSTRRLRWIEQRALLAMDGKVYREEDINLPKSVGPETNERLTKKLRAVTTQRDTLRAALQGMLAIVNDSRGVAGYHLNGDTAEWDEFDEVDAANAAIAAAGSPT